MCGGLRGLSFVARGTPSRQTAARSPAQASREGERPGGREAEDCSFSGASTGAGEKQAPGGSDQETVTHGGDDGSGGRGSQSGVLASNAGGNDQAPAANGRPAAA